MRIRDAVAFVTGANRGLGLVLAQELLAAGARKVYAAARQPERITLDGVERVRLDVTQPDTITAAARACPDVNLLINNAGIALWTGFLAPDAVEAARVEMETNYFGPLLLSRAFAPVLAQNGGGAIVNLLSILSWVAVPMAGTYSASKAAAWALTNGLRTGLREQGTHVLGVHAGPIDTDMARQLTLPKVKPVDVVRQVLRALEAGLWGSSGAGRRVACVLQNPWQLRQGRRTPPQMTCPAALYATPVGADGRRRSSRVLCSGYARGHTNHHVRSSVRSAVPSGASVRGRRSRSTRSHRQCKRENSYARQQRCLSRPCAPACRRAAGRAGGRGRRAEWPANAPGAAGPAAGPAGTGAAGGAARKGRLNFLSAAHAILQLLQDDGIDVLFNAEVVQVEGSSGQGTRIRLRTSEGERTLEGSDLLVAVGRVPNTQGLGLEKAGVECDGHGYIRVNERLQTSAPGVWAMGECAGSPHFTHVATDDFRIVRDNLNGGKRTTHGRLVPFCIFTDPELARVGLSESEAKQCAISYRLATIPMTKVRRTATTSETRGFLKALISADSDEILGFTAFGAEAGEMMAVVQTAMLGKLPYTVLRDAILAHPTMAEGLTVLFTTVPARSGARSTPSRSGEQEAEVAA